MNKKIRKSKKILVFAKARHDWIYHTLPRSGSRRSVRRWFAIWSAVMNAPSQWTRIVPLDKASSSSSLTSCTVPDQMRCRLTQSCRMPQWSVAIGENVLAMSCPVQMVPLRCNTIVTQWPHSQDSSAITTAIEWRRLLKKMNKLKKVEYIFNSFF